MRKSDSPLWPKLWQKRISVGSEAPSVAQISRLVLRTKDSGSSSANRAIACSLGDRPSRAASMAEIRSVFSAPSGTPASAMTVTQRETEREAFVKAKYTGHDFRQAKKFVDSMAGIGPNSPHVRSGVSCERRGGGAGDLRRHAGGGGG